jgi:hypothetical protein
MNEFNLSVLSLLIALKIYTTEWYSTLELIGIQLSKEKASLELLSNPTKTFAAFL